MGEFLLAWALIGALGGALIGHMKGRVGEGAVLCAFLGIIGWLLLLCGPDARRKCPACRGAVPDDASKCMHCGSEVGVLVRSEAQPLPPVLAGIDDDAVMIRQQRVECALPVYCPACGVMNEATSEQRRSGLRCAECGVGWVPEAKLQMSDDR